MNFEDVKLFPSFCYLYQVLFYHLVWLLLYVLLGHSSFFQLTNNMADCGRNPLSSEITWRSCQDPSPPAKLVIDGQQPGPASRREAVGGVYGGRDTYLHTSPTPQIGSRASILIFYIFTTLPSTSQLYTALFSPLIRNILTVLRTFSSY